MSPSIHLLNLDPGRHWRGQQIGRPRGHRGRGYQQRGANGVYYVGIKSEDQKAAEYAFLGAFSLEPFSSTEDGVTTVRGINAPVNIPDGNVENPGGGCWCSGSGCSPWKSAAWW